jgi:P4 family phage/plasmid primase-like protien
MLFADIDLKDVAESVDEIIRKLKLLKYVPSLIVRSGNGVHAYWMLTEAVQVQDVVERDRAEALLRQVADLVGGDLQVCEVARLLRLPGTHNTKMGAFKEVTVEQPRNLVGYDLGDLEEWLAEASPIILRKERVRAVTAGEAIEDNPYLAYAKEHGVKTPIDVKARLDAMMFMGGGETAVHATQLACSASMLNAGTPDQEVIDTIMAATKAACGDYGKRWNWKRELKTVEDMVESWHKKFVPKVTPAQAQAKAAASVVADKYIASNTPAPSAEVVSLAKARTAAAIKPKPAADPNDANHIIIGKAVIDVIKKRGDDLIFTEKAAWRCSGGLWTMATDGMGAWLNVEIERAARGLNFASASKLINETRLWIQRHPDLWRNDVQWDKHGLIPTKSGLVDPRTGEVRPMLPTDYCTWRIETEYDPEAECPWWLTMLEDVFADRTEEERAATISMIQELLGAGLTDDKPRELSRALVFLGGSNFGKSGLLEVLGGMFGQDVTSTPIEALEGPHGMMPFVRRRPWILHEAFDQRKWHFSSSVKAIVTGEPINVNIKNGPLISIRFTGPIFWGTNHPPQFKESSKAITNRLVVIECRREFFEDNPVGAAKEAFKQGLGKPSNLVLRDEMNGLLAWAMTGLKRALERGRLVLTKQMSKSIDEIRRDSNLVDGFLTDCCAYSHDHRLSVADFCLAFAAWWLENKGENRSVPSNEVIGKALWAMNDPKIAMGGNELRDNRRRYYGGLVLNDTGLDFHEAGFKNKGLEGKTASATEPAGNVNEPMSKEWCERPSIKAMRERQVTG